MSEARQLKQPDLQVSTPDPTPESEHSAPKAADDADADLSHIAAEFGAIPTVHNLPARSHDQDDPNDQVAVQSSSSSLLDRLTQTAFTLCLIGLVAFIAGIALSSAILTGTLDLETGWVKGSLSTLKALISSISAT